MLQGKVETLDSLMSKTDRSKRILLREGCPNLECQSELLLRVDGIQLAAEVDLKLSKSRKYKFPLLLPIPIV